MLNSFPQRPAKRRKLFIDILSAAQQKIFVTLEESQKQICQDVAADQSILYLSILEIQRDNPGVVQLDARAQDHLASLYNDVTDKGLLKQFLGASYPYLSLLIDSPIKKPTIEQLSKSLVTERPATAQHRNPGAAAKKLF